MIASTSPSASARACVKKIPSSAGTQKGHSETVLRKVTHWVSVKVSMSAVGLPEREPAPESRTPPSDPPLLVVDRLVIDVNDTVEDTVREFEALEQVSD
jgi:hypothetical protein